MKLEHLSSLQLKRRTDRRIPLLRLRGMAPYCILAAFVLLFGSKCSSAPQNEEDSSEPAIRPEDRQLLVAVMKGAATGVTSARIQYRRLLISSRHLRPGLSRDAAATIFTEYESSESKDLTILASAFIDPGSATPFQVPRDGTVKELLVVDGQSRETGGGLSQTNDELGRIIELTGPDDFRQVGIHTRQTRVRMDGLQDFRPSTVVNALCKSLESDETHAVISNLDSGVQRVSVESKEKSLTLSCDIDVAAANVESTETCFFTPEGAVHSRNEEFFGRYHEIGDTRFPYLVWRITSRSDGTVSNLRIYQVDTFVPDPSHNADDFLVAVAPSDVIADYSAGGDHPLAYHVDEPLSNVRLAKPNPLPRVNRSEVPLHREVDSRLGPMLWINVVILVAILIAIVIRRRSRRQVRDVT